MHCHWSGAVSTTISVPSSCAIPLPQNYKVPKVEPGSHLSLVPSSGLTGSQPC